MLLDGHIHINRADSAPDVLIPGFAEAGVDGGAVLSYAPPLFTGEKDAKPWRERLARLTACARAVPKVWPLFWIDPTEEDAEAQVDAAVAAGVAGFKSICNHFFPGDERPMAIWRRIADAGKPILFHSGILYGGGASSQYNRPVGFEPLLFVPHLRFSLAHISWPWCDECLAVYGKWRCEYNGGRVTSEFYIDTTCGTPPIYREEALFKLYNIGYPLSKNVIFGTDSYEDYEVESGVRPADVDRANHTKLGVSAEAQADYFGGNLLRFLGVSL